MEAINVGQIAATNQLNLKCVDDSGNGREIRIYQGCNEGLSVIALFVCQDW